MNYTLMFIETMLKWKLISMVGVCIGKVLFGFDSHGFNEWLFL